MPACSHRLVRLILVLLIALVILPFSSTTIFAQVVINEFLPNPSSGNDWVEIYNMSSDPVNISNWILDDEGTATDMTQISSGSEISGHQILVFEVATRLNKSSDTVYLLDANRLEKDRKDYNEDPGTDISIGRYLDGQNWTILQTPTKGSSNNEGNPVPTPTLIPTESPTSSPMPVPTSAPTSTPTPKPPTPTPSNSPTPVPTAAYKINEVENEDGDILSSVKIYIDGVYIHHYAPETITFCSGCKCDTYVDCGFGQHTFRLEKTGYNNWEKTEMINAAGSYEVNPVMTKTSATPAPTSTPTLTPSPTPVPTAKPLTPTPTPKVTPTPTPNPEVLGEEATGSGLYLLDEGTPSATPTSFAKDASSKKNFLPLTAIGLGVVLVFASLATFFFSSRQKA